MDFQHSSEIQKIQESFFHELIELKIEKDEALNIVSTFLFAWLKKKGSVLDIDPKEYEKDVTVFISRFKQELNK